jgi:hypothetical protein
MIGTATAYWLDLYANDKSITPNEYANQVDLKTKEFDMELRKSFATLPPGS